jgi:hypothetical protein
MAAARIDPQVIKAFIENWTTPYTVSSDEILHLHDIGISTDVLTTLIRRSAQLQAQTTPISNSGPMVPNLVTTNPPAMIYPYPGAENPAETNAPAAAAPYGAAPVYSYPSYTSLYPYSLPYLSYGYYPYYYPFYSSYYPYWYGPYCRSWPYYRCYPYGYPRGFGYYGSHYAYPGHSFGWGHAGTGWHGHR